jgi:hypothetical protein
MYNFFIMYKQDKQDQQIPKSYRSVLMEQVEAQQAKAQQADAQQADAQQAVAKEAKQKIIKLCQDILPIVEPSVEEIDRMIEEANVLKIESDQLLIDIAKKQEKIKRNEKELETMMKEQRVSAGSYYRLALEAYGFKNNNPMDHVKLAEELKRKNPERSAQFAARVAKSDTASQKTKDYAVFRLARYLKKKNPTKKNSDFLPLIVDEKLRRQLEMKFYRF